MTGLGPKREDKPVETRERGSELPTSVESVDPSNWSLLGIESAIGVFGSGWGARRPTSLHPNGVTVTFCSGATQTLARDIDPLTWAQMMMSFDQKREVSDDGRKNCTAVDLF